ncbi:MAG: metallophosphoesterase family protein [Gemmatimonadota bacterium]
MTRVAALYDIHGNLPALEAVLQEVRRESVDCIVVGGDVLPGPMPTECLGVLLALDIPVRFIQGNGEREVLAERAGMESAAIPEAFREAMRWSAGQLDETHANTIQAWPATLQLSIAPHGDVLFCHATPASDTDIVTERTSDEKIGAMFGTVESALVVCGHTHMQFDRHVGATRIVNAGSVGMPFGAPGAYWLMLDSALALRCTAYDLRSAAARIRASRYPDADQFAAGNVLNPPSREAMLSAFGGTQG